LQKLGDTKALKGYVSMLMFDEYGNLKEAREFKNLVVDLGQDGAMRRISQVATGVLPANYIRLGTDNTAPGATDSRLEGDIAEPKSAAYTRLGIGSWKLVATWGTGEAVTGLTESGVFFGSHVGSILCRQTFNVINKQSADTLEVTWGFTIA
jgi:hypothetical protein